MAWFTVAAVVRHVGVTTEVVTVAADDSEHAKTRAVHLLDKKFGGTVELLDIRTADATD